MIVIREIYRQYLVKVDINTIFIKQWKIVQTTIYVIIVQISGDDSNSASGLGDDGLEDGEVVLGSLGT